MKKQILYNLQFREKLFDYMQKFKSQKEAAKSLGISPAYLSDMLHGRRDISGEVANQFGYKKIVVFQKWTSK